MRAFLKIILWIGRSLELGLKSVDFQDVPKVTKFGWLASHSAALSSSTNTHLGSCPKRGSVGICSAEMSTRSGGLLERVTLSNLFFKSDSETLRIKWSSYPSFVQGLNSLISNLMTVAFPQSEEGPF